MKECDICKEEESEKIQLQSFPCNTCIEGCWYICKNCKDKIIKNFDKCPVCNTSISHIKISIKNIEDNEEETYTCFQKIKTTLFKYITKCLNNYVPIILIICTIIGNIALLLLLSFIFMLSCNINCSSCTGLSLLFSLINCMIISFSFSTITECDTYTYKNILGLIIFLNGIFIYITEGIKQECSGKWDTNLEVIEDTIICKCIFKPNLDMVLVIGIISGCCLCHMGNGDYDDD